MLLSNNPNNRQTMGLVPGLFAKLAPPEKIAPLKRNINHFCYYMKTQPALLAGIQVLLNKSPHACDLASSNPLLITLRYTSPRLRNIYPPISFRSL